MLPRWLPGTRDLRRHRKDRVARSEKLRKRKSLLERLEERRLLARDVSGTISADDTWSDTIRVTGNVTVADGVKLTIEPGTTVKFDPARWLVGSGEVEAIGTASDPIIFTSVQDDTAGEDLTPDTEGTPASGDWDSLFVYSGDWNLQHAEVRYGGNDLRFGSIYVDEDRDTTENATSLIQDVLVADSETSGSIWSRAIVRCRESTSFAAPVLLCMNSAMRFRHTIRSSRPTTQAVITSVSMAAR